MAADAEATQGVRASAAIMMLLTQLIRDNSVAAC